jgi:hypothetical protein
MNFEPINFFVNDNGELEYHGEVVKIYGEFRYMSKEQKLETLTTLINWANNEIEKLNNQ